MEENDGYRDWRIKESESLEKLVTEKIEFIQNPENCSAAQILKCEINRGYTCGWGMFLITLISGPCNFQFDF
jgi:glycoprotein 6-alpha-L-fucosyltransferase